MRILIDLQPCQNGSRRRGIGRYAQGLSRALIAGAGDHEIWLALSACFPDTIQAVRDDFADIMSQERIVVFATPTRTADYDPANAWRNRAAEIVRSYAFEALKPDIVFIPSPLDGLRDDTVTSVEPGPWMTAVTLHDLIPLIDPQEHLPTEHDRAGYLRKLQQIVSADLVLATSAFIEKEAIRRLDIPPARIIHTLEGVEPHFRPTPLIGTARAALLAKFNITRPFVLNTSPFEFRKNINGLLAGYACVPAKLRHMHQLVIVGKIDAHARQAIAEQARMEGLARDEVVLTGYVDDVDLVGLYSTCELFVFPSLSEGFGLPVLEAMACGAPVIGSNTTSIPEVIGRAEAMFDPLAPGEIGDLITHYLTDADRCAALRAGGLERAARFTWADAAGRAITAFERAHQAHTRTSRPAAPAATARPKLAFVFSCDMHHSRTNAYARTLLPHLWAHYDITVVTAGGTLSDPWITANYPVHDAEWFNTAAGRFERTLYNVDTQLNDIALNLIEAHPGIILLHTASRRPDAPLRPGRAMPHDVQRDLYAAGGFAAIIAALEHDEAGRPVVVAPGARLHQFGTGLIVDNPELLPATGLDADTCHLVPAVSVLPDPASGLAFRRSLDIPDAVPVVVGYASSTHAASIIAAGFRKSVAGRSTAHLVLAVACDEDKRPSAPDLQQLPGRTHRMSHNLHQHYIELLAIAELVILTHELPPAIERQLRHDCCAKGINVTLARPNPCETVGVTELSADALATFIDRSINSVKPPQPSNPLAPGTAEVAQAIYRAVEHLTARAPHARYRAVLASFPASVRNVVPGGDDLADVARAMARNASLARPPGFFLDLSSVAHADGRLRRHARRLIVALVQSASPMQVEPVAHDGTRYMTARNLAAELIGLHSSGLVDEPLALRAGDRLLDLGAAEPFATIPPETLHALQAQGVLCIQPVLGHLPFERPDLNAQIAAATIEAAQAIPSRGRAVDYEIVLHANQDTARHTGTSTVAQPEDEDSPAVARLLFTRPVASRTNISGPPPLSGAAIAHLAACLEAPPPPNAAAGIDWSRLHFVITGHVLGSYSLALINRTIARTLEHTFPAQVRLLPVETNPITDLDKMPADEQPLMRELADRAPSSSGRQIVISHHYPVLVPAGAYDLRLALFFWEETEIPQSTMALLAASFDGVITPTHFVARALVNSGLRIPAITIGVPTDTNAFARLGHRPGQTARKPWTFLHISSCFPRKGADVLLAAWARAFRASDPVRLVIKTFPNPHNTIETDAATLRRDQPDCAPIEVINRDFDKPDMIRLYEAADVMVLPTRGEGYNLPALEAMLAGIPLILTGHGAHRDFCGPRQARLIDFRFAPSGSHVSQANALWVEPDLEDLVAALREMVDPARANEIAQRRHAARDAALTAADPSVWLQRLRDLVTDLIELPPPPPAPIAWISSWQVACGIATYSAYLLGAAAAEFRRRVFVLCDQRTPPPASDTDRHDPVWLINRPAQTDSLAAAVQRHAVAAIVIQHQDGLISWAELANILNATALRQRVTLVVLHNPRSLLAADHNTRAAWVTALGRVDRLVVHRVSDMNALKELGLTDNTALLPHGATAGGKPTPIRSFSPPAAGHSAPIIGCHGFFLHHKGIDKLIRAVALLRKTWPGLRLHLVNARFPTGISDDLITECRTIAAQAGIADAIAWYTDFLPTETITELLQACDLIVLPYDDSIESASGAARTALASLTPIVATRVQIFEDLNQAVFWVNNNSPTLLCQAIDALLRDRDARCALQQAQMTWLAAHDWARVAARLEGMIDGLIAARQFA